MSTCKGKQLNGGKSVAASTCCGLCPANLQTVVSRSSCCGGAQRLLCSCQMSSPAFTKPGVPPWITF